MDKSDNTIIPPSASSYTAVAGRSLSAIVEKEGPLSATAALDMILQVGENVKFLHSQRKNHLGLQPEDILISDVGHKAMISNLGKSDYDDIHNLGCLLYYALSGERANADSLAFPSSIEPEMQEVLRKAIAPAGGEEYASVSGFLSEAHRATMQGIRQKADMRKQEEESVKKKESKSSGSKGLLWGALALLAVVAVVLVIILKPDASESESVPPQEQTALADKVENITITTTLGEATYSGEVDEAGKPHGEGTAQFSNGDRKSYTGGWVHGIMEGEATYIYTNGDTFKGRFINGVFHEGRYTFASDGLYFDGTYRQEQPWEGKWYDKNGNLKYTFKEGKLN